MGFIILAILIGLIPATIAQKKGRSFILWWIYGAAIWIVAFPHSLIMSDNRRKCPFCAESIKNEARVCPHCQRDISTNASYSTTSQGSSQLANTEPFPIRAPVVDSGQKSKVVPIVVLIVAGIVGIAAIGSALNKGPSSPAAPDLPAADSSGTGTDIQQTSGRTAVIIPTSQPQTLLDVSGDGIKSTRSFSAGGDWDLAYSFDCSEFGQSGNFAVTVYKDGQMADMAANQLSMSGNDVSHMHLSGTIYLEVNSECRWHLKVTG